MAAVPGAEDRRPCPRESPASRAARPGPRVAHSLLYWTGPDYDEPDQAPPVASLPPSLLPCWPRPCSPPAAPSTSPSTPPSYLRQQYAQGGRRPGGGADRGPLRARRRRSAPRSSACRRSPARLRRVNQVNDFIFDGLKLQYCLTPTKNAVDTYRTRSGNCLSFVNLFVGVAREMGLNPYYVEVTDLQKWNHREGMVVSQGHIVAGMYIDGELHTFDFLPYRAEGLQGVQADRRPDRRGPLLQQPRRRGAARRRPRPRPRAARHRHPHRPPLRQGDQQPGRGPGAAGEPEKALETYQRGLADQPRQLDAPGQHGARPPAARPRRRGRPALLAKVEAENTTNPFFFVYEGEVALGRGETAKARRLHGAAPSASTASCPRSTSAWSRSTSRWATWRRPGTTWAAPSSWTPPTRTPCATPSCWASEPAGIPAARAAAGIG